MSLILFKNAKLLDPLKKDLQDGFSVLVEKDAIKEVSDKSIKAKNAQTFDLKGKVLMPGLIDLHAHVVATQLNLNVQAQLPNALVLMRSLSIMQGMLRRGFTTIRDAGGGDWGLKCAIEEGDIVGPRLFISVHALSQTSGHSDIRARSDFTGAQICGCCFRSGSIGRVVDGVDALRKAVREEFLMGADQIKIMASGGVASPTDPVASMGYSESELLAIVEEASNRQSYVMAHCYTAEAIERAVRCGVRTIEHGNLVDAKTAKLMAKKGAYAVPTLVTYDALANEGAKYGLGPESVVKIETVRSKGLHSLELYKKAGVKMGFGTDLLGPSQRLQSDEFKIRTQVLSPQEVIQSATTTAAEILNMQGKLGRIAGGAMADLLVVNGNPLKDISYLLGQGENIPVVMKGGKIYFNDL